MILDYKGISVFYSDEGNGIPVVLLHGFLENTVMWKNIIPHLSKNNRVVAIDLLGHGQTGCLGYIHTMEDMAEVVNTVLDNLKIEKAILIGHSMGGYVALAMAEKFPEKFLGLCLANSTSQSDSNERKINRDRAIKAVKQNYKAFVSMAVTNLFAENNREKLKSDIEIVKQEALKTPLQGIIAALEGMKIRKNREHVLKNAQFKKLFIIGLKDTVIQPDIIRKEAETTDSQYIEFDGGHMSYIENEKLFLQNIVHFIELI
ncbi:alpha/beta hydrolase [Hanstruepera neustonica]|uniref:Alpha/beta hydrolase n=1 Tax=Hanstruepera neustonica TaxID=1445657 RepID=A0A2K1E3Z0_9FLAO|nr:alpha/beta hydrolase [Hanstruepera neustonica]PNQ74999.1 alpha/beta hydrolase [Hanstruepera neustonica]